MKYLLENLEEVKTNVEAIVAFLAGIIPDTGKSLAEYRRERPRKYENSYGYGYYCDLLEYLSQRAVISEVFCDGVG